MVFISSYFPISSFFHNFLSKSTMFLFLQCYYSTPSDKSCILPRIYSFHHHNLAELWMVLIFSHYSAPHHKSLSFFFLCFYLFLLWYFLRWVFRLQPRRSPRHERPALGMTASRARLICVNGSYSPSLLAGKGNIYFQFLKAGLTCNFFVSERLLTTGVIFFFWAWQPSCAFFLCVGYVFLICI